MKVICAPSNKIPEVLEHDCKYFSLYSNSGRQDIYYIASGWHRELEKIGFMPSNLIWDFVTIALSVSAADVSCERKNSEDGWTRQIHLIVYLHNPEPWIIQRELLEKAFKFLTGDYWKLEFVGDGKSAPLTTTPLAIQADCIALLSGGMDSLIGGIDIVSNGIKPCFVSQEAKGDVLKQKDFAIRLAPQQQHFQWKNPICLKARDEGSTRGRSIVFLAYALLAATALENWSKENIDIYIPENGFISLNVALNSGRIGSLSTKTTHPVFLGLIQNIWTNLGINASLIRPYQFKTKGEMLSECKDQPLIQSLVNNTTSCGKFLRYNNTHCGRCVPCLVRRSAFLNAGIEDKTTYVHENLSDKEAIEKLGANDIGAVATAYAKYQDKGIESIIEGSLSFSSIEERKKYVGVVERGLIELGKLLEDQKIL